jgi:hypothetical protein
MKKLGRVRPQARTDDLIVRELSEEVLVYDLTRNKAHSLNKTAALIWGFCDGRSTVPQISRLAQEQSATPVNDQVVWLALEQLGKSHLLRNRIIRPVGEPQITRRDLVRLGLAAAAVPVVFSIVAPLAVQAATCVMNAPNCLPNNTNCTTSSQCCQCCCHQTGSGNPPKCTGISTGTCL